MFKSTLLQRAVRALAPIAIAAASSMAGCAAVPPAPVEPVPALPEPVVVLPPAPPPSVPAPLPAPDETARILVGWQNELRQANQEGIAAIAAQVAAQVAAQPNIPAQMVHQALVHLHTRGAGDAARALALIDAVAASTDPQAAAWQELMPLLSARAADQKRQDETNARWSQQLRDSQRKIEQMNEQLEALKAIERSLAPKANGKNP